VRRALPSTAVLMALTFILAVPSEEFRAPSALTYLTYAAGIVLEVYRTDVAASSHNVAEKQQEPTSGLELPTC